MTESSACFEDTLFADAPKKTKTAPLAKGMKLSSSTAAFIPFGESAVATTYKNFITSRNQTTLNANIDSEGQATAHKSSYGKNNSSRTAPYIAIPREIYGQQSMDSSKNNTILSLQRVQKTTLEYGSKGDGKASGTQAVEFAGAKINPMSPPAMPTTIHERNSNKLGVVNTTSPKINKDITTTAAPVSSTVVKKTNLISARSVVPLKQKPMPSAGLTSIKRADPEDQIHKSAKRAVTSIASDNSKSLRRHPIHSQSQKNLTSEGKVGNSLPKVNKSRYLQLSSYNIHEYHCDPWSISINVECDAFNELFQRYLIFKFAVK